MSSPNKPSTRQLLARYQRALAANEATWPVARTQAHKRMIKRLKSEIEKEDGK